MGKASHQPPGLKLPKGKIPALRVVPMPADANHNGDIFGGFRNILSTLFDNKYST